MINDENTRYDMMKVSYLLFDIGDRTAQQLDKKWDSASFNDVLCLDRSARGNVGQGPSSLELDW